MSNKEHLITTHCPFCNKLFSGELKATLKELQDHVETEHLVKTQENHCNCRNCS